MPQYLTDESRLESNAHASTRGRQTTKGRMQENREKATQRWLDSRTAFKPDTERIRPPTWKTHNMVTLKHKLGPGHGYPITAIAFSPTAPLLATASRDVRLYDTTTGKLRAILDAHGGLVRALAFSPDGKLLCSGGDDCASLVWVMDAVDTFMRPGPVPTLTPAGYPSSTNLPAVHTGVSPTVGPGAAATASHGAATMMMASTAAVAAADAVAAAATRTPAASTALSRTVHKAMRGHTKPILAMATTPDSKCLITGSADRTVKVWEVATGYCRTTLTGHHGDVTTVAVTPNGKTIFSGGADRMVYFWDAASGECIRSLKGHKGAVSSISVAPDGQWLVTGGHDKMLRVWDVTNGGELATLPAHDGSYGVLCCAVSPDSSTIISGGYDHLVKLWDANSGMPLATLDSHRHMVSAVAFSPDCTVLATAGRDDEVRLWMWVGRYEQKQWSKKTIGWETAYPEQARALREGRDVTTRPAEQADNRHWGCVFGAVGPTPGRTVGEEGAMTAFKAGGRARAASAGRTTGRPATAPAGMSPRRAW